MIEHIGHLWSCSRLILVILQRATQLISLFPEINTRVRGTLCIDIIYSYSKYDIWTGDLSLTVWIYFSYANLQTWLLSRVIYHRATTSSSMKVCHPSYILFQLSAQRLLIQVSIMLSWPICLFQPKENITVYKNYSPKNEKEVYGDNWKSWTRWSHRATRAQHKPEHLQYCWR